MVNLPERSQFLFIVFVLSVHQYVQCELTEKNQIDQRNKPLEKQNTVNIYSSSKANDFLSYDKCMQRMKCPLSRKEECSEECQAGNTEEEIEEHNELTINEHRNSINKKPKPKFDTTKYPTETTTTTIKTDL